MKLGIIGLGRMGSIVAIRAARGGHEVIGYDPSEQVRNDIKNMSQKNSLSIKLVDSIELVAQEARVIWLMVPAGKIVDTVISALLPHARKDDIVIDGGNSNFKDSQRRSQFLKDQAINFLDCGSSGGLHAREFGFSLMVGGDKAIYALVEPLLNSIGAHNGVGYVGPSGAGHYVKMVHNGIEYALLQAYAEGFELLHKGAYTKDELDLQEITRIWAHGSIIRSWIVDLAHDVFKEHGQELTTISGAIQESGTGLWTVQEAHEQKITVDLIERSLDIRRESRETGGTYATKIVALLRHQFGGHNFDTKK